MGTGSRGKEAEGGKGGWAAGRAACTVISCDYAWAGGGERGVRPNNNNDINIMMRREAKRWRCRRSNSDGGAVPVHGTIRLGSYSHHHGRATGKES